MVLQRWHTGERQRAEQRVEFHDTREHKLLCEPQFQHDFTRRFDADCIRFAKVERTDFGVSCADCQGVDLKMLA